MSGFQLILGAQDAVLAAEAGVDGILISNHGGKLAYQQSPLSPDGHCSRSPARIVSGNSHHLVARNVLTLGPAPYLQSRYSTGYRWSGQMFSKGRKVSVVLMYPAENVGTHLAQCTSMAG